MDPGIHANPGAAVQSEQFLDAQLGLYVPPGHSVEESRGYTPGHFTPGGHTKKLGDTEGVQVLE